MAIDFAGRAARFTNESRRLQDQIADATAERDRQSGTYARENINRRIGDWQYELEQVQRGAAQCAVSRLYWTGGLRELTQQEVAETLNEAVNAGATLDELEAANDTINEVIESHLEGARASWPTHVTPIQYFVDNGVRRCIRRIGAQGVALNPPDYSFSQIFRYLPRAIERSARYSGHPIETYLAEANRIDQKVTGYVMGYITTRQAAQSQSEESAN